MMKIQMLWQMDVEKNFSWEMVDWEYLKSQYKGICYICLNVILEKKY